MGEYKFINEELKIGTVTAKNRLVMPPMQTDKARMGRATEDMIKYYRDRAVYSRPGLIITEHCYVAKGGRIEDQLSIADDSVIEDHYMDGGNTEEDAVEAAKLIEKAGADLLDVFGGMCGYIRAGHDEPGYFRSMTEKIKASISMPVILTGGVKTLEDAEALLEEGAADMIGAGRAILTNPVWGKRL